MTTGKTKLTDDLDMIRRLDGFFIGMLSPEEMAAFDRLVDAGAASRSYEGANGFMGLGKVKLIREARS